MNSIPKTEDLFDISHSIASAMLGECEYPHIALSRIEEVISQYANKLDRSFKEIRDGVFVANDAKIWDGATLVAPVIIGHKTEVRPGAFIRGNVIIGNGAVIGNSTEIKNSIILDEAQLPHYNYVGDSIVGYRAHMGAGAIASNLRLDKGEVFLFCGEEKIATGRRKVGAFIGDYAEVGCGCVLCPGTLICRESRIYPLISVCGCIPERCVFDGTNIKNINCGDYNGKAFRN